MFEVSRERRAKREEQESLAAIQQPVRTAQAVEGSNQSRPTCAATVVWTLSSMPGDRYEYNRCHGETATRKESR